MRTVSANVPQPFMKRAIFAGGLTVYDMALTMDPANPRLHYSRANTLVLLNPLDQAIAAYESCFRLDPSHTSAMYNRATMRARLQRWADALEDLDHTLSLSPHMADDWNNRAPCHPILVAHEQSRCRHARAFALEFGALRLSLLLRVAGAGREYGLYAQCDLAADRFGARSQQAKCVQHARKSCHAQAK